ncbi:Glucan 1,3-beta-glucosidase BGL2 [Zancudomyces culisetae]|uniref:glucan endo-1,3-beta-D-glucosidase n=1 Tax=Zancudomyces culisetae TaxID=1213189 RepID=A0A1R1PNM5_ZANCU|nr:Glucan 1,3-beta-glucosidase BGL2 [Zancudomyces culisetae]|eukprot:OMH82541.1 Glucan 1,3-beta-glucosidase BGL2 [Zancudomyces culisetae]
MKVALSISLATLLTFAAADQNVGGLTYNPRNNDGSCPTMEKIQNDLTLLEKNADSLRIYSLVDCGVGEMILDAVEGTDWNLDLGLWVSNNEDEFNAELDELVRLSSKPSFADNVSSVVVGNDAISRGEQTGEDIAAKIRRVRDELAGVDKPKRVTSAELSQNYSPAVIAEADYVMMNAFPLWNGYTVHDAICSIYAGFQQLQGSAGGKEIVLGQTGWPTSGSDIGISVPSVDTAFQYIQEYVCTCRNLGIKCYYFTAIDSDWKAGSHDPFVVEAHFGLYYNNNTPKFAQEDWFDCRNVDTSCAPNIENPPCNAPDVIKAGKFTPGSNLVECNPGSGSTDVVIPETSDVVVPETSDVVITETTDMTSEETILETTLETNVTTTEEITLAETTDETILETVDVTSEEITNVTSEETVDVTSEEITNVTSEETVDVTSEETVDVTSEETVDVTSEETVDVTSEEITNVTSEESTDTTVEDIVDIFTEEASLESTEAAGSDTLLSEVTTDVIDVGPETVVADMAR